MKNTTKSQTLGVQSNMNQLQWPQVGLCSFICEVVVLDKPARSVWISAVFIFKLLELFSLLWFQASKLSFVMNLFRRITCAASIWRIWLIHMNWAPECCTHAANPIHQAIIQFSWWKPNTQQGSKTTKWNHVINPGHQRELSLSLSPSYL